MNVCLQKYLLCPTPAKEVDQEGSFDDKVACKGNRINEQGDFISNYLSLQPEKDTYQQYEENMDTCSPDHLFGCNTGTRSFYQCRPCQQLHLAWNEEWKCFRTTHFGCRVKGWTLSAWGSTEFRNENNEIDLTLEYEYKNLQLCLNNYFYQSEDEPFKYFHYTPRTTGHTFEAGAVYTVSERFPLSIGWYTTFAGNDYRENEERAWSSYCEFSYPFTVKGVDLAVEAGFTPWEGEYADKLNVVNVGLSATKTLNISSGFTPAIFGKLIANPYENRFYFVFGISL